MDLNLIFLNINEKETVYINSKKIDRYSDKRIKKIKKIFDNSFIKAVDLILNCKGKLSVQVLENQV